MQSRHMVFVFSALLAATSVIVPDTIANAASSSNDELVAKINDLRASKGVSPLSSDIALANCATRWSRSMAGTGALSHQDLSSLPGTGAKAENVGEAPDVEALFEIWMASPKHYANMTDPSFNRIGAATTPGAGAMLYGSVELAQGTSSAVDASPTKAPGPSRAPANHVATKRVASPTLPQSTTTASSPPVSAPSTPPAPITAPSTPASPPVIGASPPDPIKALQALRIDHDVAWRHSHRPTLWTALSTHKGRYHQRTQPRRATLLQTGH